MASYFDPGDGNFVMVDGNIVERDALHIAEKIKEYDENLELFCLDPDLADVNDAPFVVCERRGDILYRVMEAWSLDEKILERIYMADQNRHNIQAYIDGKIKTIRDTNERRYKEKLAENNEMMLAALVNKKSSFRFENKNGDMVTVHENAPIEYNNNKKSFSSVGNPTKG